jgi:integrase
LGEGVPCSSLTSIIASQKRVRPGSPANAEVSGPNKKVHVEIERTAESLYQGHGSGHRARARQTGFADQMARDRSVDDTEHLRDHLRSCRQQVPQRERQRQQHPKYVFTYCGERQKKINNSGWQGARKRAGLSQVRVYDLKHTFGRRLRAAGVSFEDRQDLLGHRSGRITSHYSAAELTNLILAANKVVGQGSRKSSALVMLKKKVVDASALTA